jgi:hypothetical protein
MIVDPTMTVDFSELPPGWDQECRDVLRRFYQGPELMAAYSELLLLVNQTGSWGKDVEQFQADIRLSATDAAGKYHIQVLVAEQLNAWQLKPHILWKLKYSEQFPKLTEPSIRVSVMATQSADVERVCKVHKLVHTKSRNRLKNANVYKLLFCYVNLRLLKSLDLEHDDKEMDKEDVLEDFLGQAILENTEPDGPDDEEVDELGDDSDASSDGL